MNMTAIKKTDNTKTTKPVIDFEHFKFVYPEEMEKLIYFLHDKVVLNCDYHILEKMWYVYSHRCCADFLTVNKCFIDEFVDELCNIPLVKARICDYEGFIDKEHPFVDEFYSTKKYKNSEDYKNE